MTNKVGFDKDTLRKKLKSGQRIYGTCITSTTPIWPTVVSGADLDFVFIDTEHMPLDRSQLATLCRNYQALGLTPIVRIPQPNPYRASQAIDDGAIGLIVPYLEHLQEIRELIGAVKYRPLKGEKLKEILEGSVEVSQEMKSYFDNNNYGSLCIANIESMPAVDRLDELLSVKGLDGVFIGPHDLSVNMGLPEQYDHPEFKRVVKYIIRKAREHTLGVGIHFSLTPQRQVEWIQEGANIVIHSSDMALFGQRLKEDMKEMKHAVGDDMNELGEEVTI